MNFFSLFFRLFFFIWTTGGFFPPIHPDLFKTRKSTNIQQPTFKMVLFL